MFPPEKHYTEDVTTFDGKTHKLTAWKVGGYWRASATVDGKFIRGGGARTLERAIEYFQTQYRARFER
jgi:hypothetical protein